MDGRLPIILQSGVGMNRSLSLFIASKIIRIITLLIALCIICFILISMSPIDPVQAYVGADMLIVGSEQLEKIKEYWGLDKSPQEQFLKWGSALIQGDFGTSSIYRRPVLDVIADKFLASLDRKSTRLNSSHH